MKIKKVLKNIFKVLFVIFVGVATFAGTQEFVTAWGFREDGLIASLSGLIGIYVMIVIAKTNHREILYGKEDHTSKRIQE